MVAPRAEKAGRGLRIPQVPKILVYLVGFLPAVSTFWMGLNDRLGPDPIRTLELTLGLWALRFLILSLCVTPLRQVFGINLLRYRRALGLLAFYYALLHLATWLILDQGLNAHAIVADILKRPYITIGMAAFAILLPLAITSNNAMVRRMGGKAWSKLHKLVYLAAALAALHFVMVVKSWPAEPLIYAAIVAVLLLYRAWKAWGPGGMPARRAT